MIVRMRDNIEPLCDRDFSAMQLEGFTATNIQLTFRAYACKEPGCTRAYNSSLGYFDVSNTVSLEDQVRRECPEEQTFMFVSGVSADSGKERWTCAQVHCDHSEIVEPVKRSA